MHLFLFAVVVGGGGGAVNNKGSIYTAAWSGPAFDLVHCCIYYFIHSLQSGPDLNHKFDVIITLNTSFICYTSDDNSVFLICYTFRWQFYVPDSRWGTMKCKRYSALTTELIDLSQAQFAAILGQLYVPQCRWGTMKCEQYSALTTELIDLSQAQFAAILGQPSVNTVSCAWPEFSLV